jgi:Ca2+-binding RTX toxin-like protein
MAKLSLGLSTTAARLSTALCLILAMTVADTFAEDGTSQKTNTAGSAAMTQGPSQGLNLGGQPSAYADTFSALNLFHGADAWITIGPGGEEIRNQVKVDEKGWLTELPVVNGVAQPVIANIFYTKVLPAGNYIVEWKGEGELTSYSNVEPLGDHKFRIKWDGSSPTNENGISLIIESTDPNKTGDYIRDIMIYKEEYSDLVAMGEQFDPNWFQAIDDFRVLRTHDWQGTNFSKVTGPTPNDFTSDQAFWIKDGRGMPIELLVKVANEARSDLWINIPHMATDAYMREVAQYVKDNLAKDLKVYVEYTNEYWTTIFDQHDYLIAQGQQKFGDVPFANAQAYGARASEMTQIFKQVFGTEQSRLIPTVTLDDVAFSTDEAITMLTTPAYVAKGGISPLDAGIKFLATDGYLSWYNSDPATDQMVDQWMKQPDGGFASARDYLLNQLKTQLAPNWQLGRALADQYGLKFGVYEGGALLLNGPLDAPGDPKYTDFNQRFQLSAEIKKVYEAELAAWQKVGSGPFAWYSDTGRSGPWGDYGLWNAPDYKPEKRTEAIIAANSGTAPWWTGDDRPASTFENGKYAVGTTGVDQLNGTALADRLYAINGDDTIRGAAGNDLLVGGIGNDKLYGGADDDKLYGGDGNDLIQGDAGKNLLLGGAGDDTFIGGSGIDDVNGEAGSDIVKYDRSVAAVKVNLATNVNTGGDAEGDKLTGVERVSGSNFADTIVGDAQANTLLGLGGNDRLDGGQGNDQLRGGDGDDTISGGLGNDSLSGGAGKDVFRFTEVTFGKDVITDFSDGIDKLSFATSVADAFSDFTITGNGTTSVMVSVNGQTINVKGTSAITLDASDFLFS